MIGSTLDTPNTTQRPADRAATRTTNPAPGQAQGRCPLHRLAEMPEGGPLAARLGVLAFGLLAYAMFFGVVLYTIGFLTGLVVPKDINEGPLGSPFTAVLVNGAFLLAFAAQHTVMARRWFKDWVTRYIPRSMERSLFVFAASAILGAMFVFWRPMPEVIYAVDTPLLWWALTGLSLLGFAIVFYSTFLINHFDLFGLRQVALQMRGRPYTPVGFKLKSLYRLVRHPLMVGFLIAFWATPTMTVGHLFFAVMCTGYIFFGVAIEERDLIAAHGEDYLRYKRRVRGFLPIPRLGAAGGGGA